jgi:hypothetical protein
MERTRISSARELPLRERIDAASVGGWFIARKHVELGRCESKRAKEWLFVN